MTCILCPTGCVLTVEWTAAAEPTVVTVRGERCMKGRDYAIEEITRPIRTLTTTVLVTRGVRPLTSVKTAEPIPRKSIAQALRELKILAIPAPVYIGQLVMEDVAGTGISVVATRNMAAETRSEVRK